MRIAPVLGIVIGAASLLGGCGPSCQSTCQRIYNPAECGIRIPGQEWQTSARDCTTDCESALDQPGDVGNYNPFEVNTTGATVDLENEKQAALWMDCVNEMPCEDLDDGFCAPI